MSQPTVLVVDDHQLMRDMWTAVIQNSGQAQVLKYPGRQTDALDIIRDKKPDVILLDIGMTPYSGFELMPIIKQFSPQSKVIALTVHTNPAYARQMLSLGASGYVTKDSEATEILTAIREVHKGNYYLNNDIREIIRNVKKRD